MEAHLSICLHKPYILNVCRLACVMYIYVAGVSVAAGGLQ